MLDVNAHSRLDDLRNSSRSVLSNKLALHPPGCWCTLSHSCFLSIPYSSMASFSDNPVLLHVCLFTPDHPPPFSCSFWFLPFKLLSVYSIDQTMSRTDGRHFSTYAPFWPITKLMCWTCMCVCLPPPPRPLLHPLLHLLLFSGTHSPAFTRLSRWLRSWQGASVWGPSRSCATPGTGWTSAW